MQGKGKYRTASGDTYEGIFKKGAFTGEGVFTSIDGYQYKGQFENWQLNGEGSYTKPDGLSYQGEFKDHQYHGKGTLRNADGNVLVGTFDSGLLHGEAVITYAKPINGVSKKEGVWVYGQFQGPNRDDKNKRKRALVEKALYEQSAVLKNALNDVKQGQKNTVEMYFLGLGGDGSQRVFKREINFVKNKVDTLFDVKGKSISLLNTLYPEGLPLATRYSFKMALNEMALKMNKNEDILFLYLSSHGSLKFSLSIKQPGLSLDDLSLDDVKNGLKESAIKWKIIIVSACYSGGFADALKDDNTLVITAAAKDKTSFGCSDDSDLTYFAKAFFRDSLTQETSFYEAFVKADKLIQKWEVDEKIEEISNPQFEMGDAMRAYLKRYRKSLN